MEINIEKGKLRLTRQGEALLKAMQIEIQHVKEELHPKPCPCCHFDLFRGDDCCARCGWKPFELKGRGDY